MPGANEALKTSVNVVSIKAVSACCWVCAKDILGCIKMPPPGILKRNELIAPGWIPAAESSCAVIKN